ncbi:hypothetical protein U9M48_013600 [Paspalum notatum var. saurae]|uniref:Uncharacterized protein n=1 Tax=Paspalum notatum var. saurae TaxID=547442 RepID=A0AAQ3T2J3_PASNO
MAPQAATSPWSSPRCAAAIEPQLPLLLCHCLPLDVHQVFEGMPQQGSDGLPFYLALCKLLPVLPASEELQHQVEPGVILFQWRSSTTNLLRADIDFERNYKPGCPQRSPIVRSYSAKVKASLLVQFCPFRCHEHNLTHAGCGGVGHYNEDRYRILNQGPEGGAILHGTNSF